MTGDQTENRILAKVLRKVDQDNEELRAQMQGIQAQLRQMAAARSTMRISNMVEQLEQLRANATPDIPFAIVADDGPRFKVEFTSQHNELWEHFKKVSSKPPAEAMDFEVGTPLP